MPFERWNDRLATAIDKDTQRAMLAEISLWRARNLRDLPGQREAAFAMTQIYRKQGNDAAARREAEGLLSLCQSTPEAGEEETKLAKGLVHDLGGRPAAPRAERPARPERAERPVRPERSERPMRTDRPERPPRPERPARPERPERPARAERPLDYTPRPAVDPVAEAVAFGRWDDALKAIEGKRGDRPDLVRTYVLLAKALAEPDETKRHRDLGDLERNLRTRILAVREAREARAKEPRPERPVRSALIDPNDPLAPLLGGSIPADAKARTEAIEAAAEKVDLDDLASAALDHHVRAEGEQSVAPWLIGVVVRAYAEGIAPKTHATVARLATAWAATAYSEPAFPLVVDAWHAAKAAGFEFVAVRRGLGIRGEPKEPKAWTLRMRKDGAERLFVALPGRHEWHPDALPRFTSRILELCPTAVLVAPDDAAVRDAAASIGVAVSDAGAAIATLAAATPAAHAPRERAGDTLDAVRALLAGPEAPNEDALAEQLAKLPRVYRAFAVATEVLPQFSPADADARLAILLRAADKAAPKGAALAEGTSLAIRSAATVDKSAAAACLLSGPSAVRFGGPRADALVAIGAALGRSGMIVDRVLRGTTVRERKDDKALDALGDAADGFWRLLVLQGEKKAEVWLLGDLKPEGKAAVTRLLQTPAPRVVVVPVDGDLLAWYGTIGGPEAVGWTGGEAADVVAETGRVAS